MEEEKSRIYKFFREYGFMSVFLIHLAWYGSLLYIMVNKIVLNQLMVRMNVDLSLFFFAIGMIVIFKTCLDDVNIRFYDVCLSTLITRAVVRSLTYFGLDNPYWVMIFSMGMFILFTLVLLFGRKYKNRHGNRIARALFP